MKNILYATIFSMMLASPTMAGGLATPQIEPVIIEQDTTKGNILVPLLILVIVGAAIAS